MTSQFRLTRFRTAETGNDIFELTHDDPPPVQDGEETPGTGFNDGEYGFAGGARYVTRDWQVSAGYRQIGDAFNPEVGFLNRRSYRHVNTRILRHIRTEGTPWFREFRPHVSWSQFWTLGGSPNPT